MVDNRSPEKRSHTMRMIRSKNTGPEMAVRQLLHRIGYRYRLHRRDLPGTPDLVFTSREKVIFVHGCFWHLHGCRLGQLPKSRLDYWKPKLLKNRENDMKNISRLEEEDWRVLVVWQCEVFDTDALKERLVCFLEGEVKHHQRSLIR